MGFALGHPDVINRLNRMTGPYDINSFAVAAAFAALQDQAYVDHYVAEVLKARKWMQKQLIEAKVKHHIEAGNYFLLWPNHDVNITETFLRERGVLIRNMAGKSLIEGSIRVSIGTPNQMKFFWEAYKIVEKLSASI